MLGQVLGQSIQKEQCTASLHFEEEEIEKLSFKYLLQVPAYDEDGETIGMTTNSDVSSHPQKTELFAYWWRMRHNKWI